MNVYLGDLHTAVNFLSNKALNISNLLYIGEDFNIRDAEWNPPISSHPPAGQILIDLAKSYSLVCLIPVLSVPTYYLDIEDHANSVINLIFLSMSCAQVTYHTEPDIRWLSDYAPLIVDLSIVLENICVCKIVLKCDNDKEVAFLLSVNKELFQLDFSTLDTGLCY